MCKEKASDNTRALYQAACQLRIHWSDVIVRNIHYTILLVTAIWGLLGKAYIEAHGAASCGQAWWYLFAAAMASSIVLILWRWYSHYIDEAITKLYPELVFYEAKLGAENDQGTLRSILSEVVKESDKSLNRLVSPEQKKVFIQKLVENKRVGCRGHNTFDIIAIVAVVASWIGGLLLTWDNLSSTQVQWFVIGFVVAMFFFTFAFAWYFQGKPSGKDISDAMKMATGQDSEKTATETGIK